MQPTNHKPTLATTLESQGRIPVPKVPWPIASHRFASMARQWRSFGVWLSLWGHDGQPILADEHAPRFWQTLWLRRKEFSRALSAHVLQAMNQPAARERVVSGASTARMDGTDAGANDEALRLPQEVTLQVPDLGPLQPDLGFIVVPVRRRKRILGVLVGGVITSDLSSEPFVRLCDASRLDHASTTAMAAELPRFTMQTIASVSGLLKLAVEQAQELDLAYEEEAALTQNLENTYEELNLIYRISARMGLPQRPQDMLARVGNQLLEISRAVTVAFVLTEQETDRQRRINPEFHDTDSPADRVVLVGKPLIQPEAPDSIGVPQEQDHLAAQARVAADHAADLIRLVEALRLDRDGCNWSDAGHVLVNNAPRRPELAWTGSWLDHLVVLPLAQEERLLGVMLAINCKDHGDFTSVDVQLLRAVADRVASFLENQRLYDELADLLMGLLHAIVNSIDAKDPYTCGHSERVAFLSRTLARAANLTEAECQRVYLAGLLHDVGKIGVPDAILCKPGKLTTEEFDVLKQHPVIGVRILSPVRQTHDLLPGVRYHHERIDGRGYPDALAGEDIPLLGRIICLADSFDAMTSSRTYRAALPIEAAIEEVKRCAGTQFDSHLASLFLGLDLERLLQEARVSSEDNAKLAHVGALHTILGGQLTKPESQAREAL